jgi:hypothetical protein
MRRDEMTTNHFKYHQGDYKMGKMKRTTILIIAMLIASVFISTTFISRNTLGTPPTPTGSFTNTKILDNKTVILTLGVFVPYTRYEDCQIVVRDPLSWTARWNPGNESSDWVDNMSTMRDAFPGVNISINDSDGNRRLTPDDLLSIDAGNGYLANGNWSVSLLYVATGGTTIIEKTFQIVNDYPDPYPRYTPPFPFDSVLGIIIVVAALIIVSLILYRRGGMRLDGIKGKGGCLHRQELLAMDARKPIKKKRDVLAVSIMGVGVAMQAVFLLSFYVLVLFDIQLLFLTQYILVAINIIGIWLFIAGLFSIIIAHFPGWKGWNLLVRIAGLSTLIVSVVTLGFMFYAVFMMMPGGLFGTYQGDFFGTMFIYGGYSYYSSFLTLFLLAYVLLLVPASKKTVTR